MPDQKQTSPLDQSAPQIVVGGGFGPSRYPWRNKLLSILRHRLLMAGIGLGILLIAGTLFAFHDSLTSFLNNSHKGSPAPIAATNSGSHKGTSPSPTGTSGGTDQAKPGDKPADNKTTPVGSSPSAGGPSGGAGGGSSGSGASGAACAGPANHVAGGRDGTGSCWPGPDNTGVPVGTTLNTYGGPCTISVDNTVIDSKTVNCALSIQAANVTIKNSKVNGNVILDVDRPSSNAWHLTIQDSEVDAGTIQEAALGWGNLTAIRVNVHGGVTAAQCEENSVSCVIQDSYLHGQYIQPNSNWHLGGFLSDGGGPITLTHNYVVCDQQAVYGTDGGCTGDINLIPNFATAHNVTITHNLLGANIHSAFCTYGGDRHDGSYPYGNHIVYTDNIFQRGTNGLCAGYGPVAGWGTDPTNQWVNNTWADGGAVTPAY